MLGSGSLLYSDQCSWPKNACHPVRFVQREHVELAAVSPTPIVRLSSSVGASGIGDHDNPG